MSEDDPIHYKPEDDYNQDSAGNHEFALIVLSPAGVAVGYRWTSPGLQLAEGEALKRSYLSARQLIVDKLKDIGLGGASIALELESPDSDDETVLVYLGPGASVTVRPWRRMRRHQAEGAAEAAKKRAAAPQVQLMQGKLPPGAFRPGGRG